MHKLPRISLDYCADADTENVFVASEPESKLSLWQVANPDTSAENAIRRGPS